MGLLECDKIVKVVRTQTAGAGLPSGSGLLLNAAGS